MSKHTAVRLSLFAALMLCVGLLLPAGVEWMTDRSVGAEQTVPVEAIDYQANSGTLMDILNIINSSAEVTQQEVKEGYNYTQDTAVAHARELALDFLHSCGLLNAESYWREQFLNLMIDCEATLVVAPDFPTPWSAIIWWVDMPELDVYILFDDATGALLGLNLCMFGEEKLLMRGGNPMEYSDLAEKCAAVYAEQLGGIQLLQLENIGMDEALYVWHFELADENDQTVRVNLMFSFPSDTSPYLILEPMGDGYYFDPSQMTDELYPEENLADALGVKGQ